MLINSLSSSVIATAVWNQATRKLTNGILSATVSSASSTALAAGTGVNIQPSAGHIQFVSAFVTVVASGSGVGLYDGTTFVAFSQTAGMFGPGLTLSTNSVYVRIYNNSGASFNYEYCLVDFVIA